MKLKYYTLGMALLASINSGCKKEKTLSGLELITTRDWRATSVTRQTPPADPVETFTIHSECIKDDKYVFRPDGLFLRLEGPTRCNDTDPDVQSTAEWSISPDGKTLTFAGQPNEILTLTADSLVYQVTAVLPEIRIIRYVRYE